MNDKVKMLLHHHLVQSFIYFELKTLF